MFRYFDCNIHRHCCIIISTIIIVNYNNGLMFLIMKYLLKNETTYIDRDSSAPKTIGIIEIRYTHGTQNILQRWYRSAFRTPWAASSNDLRFRGWLQYESFSHGRGRRMSMCGFRGKGVDLWSFICWDTESSRAENLYRAPRFQIGESRFSVITSTEKSAKKELQRITTTIAGLNV